MATSVGEIYGSLLRNRGVILGQIDALLLRAVVTGESAVTTAKKVAQYLSPWYATRRKPTGGLVRDDRQGLVTSWPGQSGAASQHARLLMLTETTRQHSVAVVTAAKEQGHWVERRIGAYHPKSDECDGLAGEYPADEVPRPPTHPRCRCWLRSIPVPRGR